MSRWMATISFMIVLVVGNFYYLSRQSAQASPQGAGTSEKQAPNVQGAELPRELSALNLFSDLPNLQAADGIEAYDVKYPLWSDGTIKLRHVYLPQGGKLQADDGGWFYFPNGAMLAKTFIGQLNDGSTKKLETRILSKQDDRWTYAVYVWNEAGTDATMSDGDDQVLDVTLNGTDKPYVVPGRAACLQCHAGVADTGIGFAPFQLNESQIWKLQAAGHLDDPNCVKTREVTGRDGLEKQALGYIAGNCAHCHNPKSTAFVGHELDLSPGLDAASLIGVRPARLVRPDAKLLVTEGRPEASLLFRLFERSFSDSHDTDKFMPPVGNAVVDPAGRKLLSDWIKSLDRPLANAEKR